MSKGGLAHLLGRHISEHRLTPSKRRAPETTHGLDVVFSLFVIDTNALATLDDKRSRLAKFHEIGVRVQNTLHVAHLRVGKGHSQAFLSEWKYMPCRGRPSIMLALRTQNTLCEKIRVQQSRIEPDGRHRYPVRGLH